MVPGISRARRRAITAGLLIGTFLAAIEATVVGTAMPSIADQLGGFHLYPWVWSAYLLSQTVSIPLYGRLADLFGRRVIYVGGVSLFLVGAVACAVAPSMEALVAARALQGLGAGSVLPLTMTIFGDLYEVSARTKLQGLFALVWGTSSVAGPLAGGAIVLHWSWRWVFWLNLPFGLLSLALVGLLREQRMAAHPPARRLDWLGAALLTLATLLLLVALLPAEQRPAGLPAAVWLVAAGAAAAAFLAVERRQAQPVVPLDLFRDRVHVAANGMGVLLGVVLFGIVGYTPLYIQAVRGGTPVEAGAVLVPLSLGWSGASVIAGRLVRRVGFQSLVRVGSVLIALGSMLGAAGVFRDQAWASLAGITLYGVGMGCCISSFTVSVQERVAPHRRGIATALTQFSRSIGGAVGVAALGAILLSVVGADPTAGGALDAMPPDLRTDLAEGLMIVFAIMAGAAVLAGAVGLTLFPRVEEGMAESRRKP